MRYVAMSSAYVSTLNATTGLRSGAPALVPTPSSCIINRVCLSPGNFCARALTEITPTSAVVDEADRVTGGVAAEGQAVGQLGVEDAALRRVRPAVGDDPHSPRRLPRRRQPQLDAQPRRHLGLRRADSERTRAAGELLG